MNRFSHLFQSLDETNSTNRKVTAMRDFFKSCDPAEGAWAIHFLSGRKSKRVVTTKQLRSFACQLSGHPDWVFEACYDAVGDLAETIALLLPAMKKPSTRSLPEWISDWIEPLRGKEEAEQAKMIAEIWSSLSQVERFVFNKIITGGFRVGVSQQLVVRALAQAADLEASRVAHRLMGKWEPSADFFKQLCTPGDVENNISQPYPFCLANPIHPPVKTLGNPDDWAIEWKWDGIRAQLIRREGESFIWSRGEELMNGRFPELETQLESIPNGTVLDGEIVAWQAGKVLTFQELQRRINRKQIGKKLLAEVPVQFIAFDLLESQGKDLRQQTLSYRRMKLEECLEDLSKSIEASSVTGDRCNIQRSKIHRLETWKSCEELQSTSRSQNVEGLMLKRFDSSYEVGRPVGTWWKWKVDPLTCDAVLIYAQRGHGRRAGQYTDYTFAAWEEGELVPFAKAYSGLTNAEILEVDRFVRRNTIETYGPVRSVRPELVFEIAFEQISRSKRHKSGLAVRFPRIVRWRRDKSIHDADTLQSIRSLGEVEGTK